MGKTKLHGRVLIDHSISDSMNDEYIRDFLRIRAAYIDAKRAADV